MFSVDLEGSVRCFEPPHGAAPAEDERWFSTKQEFRALPHTKGSLIAIWNNFAGTPEFPGTRPLKKFDTVGAGVDRIWEQIQKLDPNYVQPAEPEPAEADPAADAQPLAEGESQEASADEPIIQNDEERQMKAKSKKPRKQAKPRTQKAAGKPKATRKAKSKAATTKRVAGGKTAKTAKPKGEAGHRGAKREIVMKLLERKSGATCQEIMDACGGWKPHSVRGYLSTLRSKHGVAVVFEKNEKRGGVYSVSA